MSDVENCESASEYAIVDVTLDVADGAKMCAVTDTAGQPQTYEVSYLLQCREMMKPIPKPSDSEILKLLNLPARINDALSSSEVERGDAGDSKDRERARVSQQETERAKAKAARPAEMCQRWVRPK